MICRKCGRKISVETKKCPFCGTINSYAANHEKNMKAYDKSFKQTQKTVNKKLLHLSLKSKICVIMGFAAFALIIYIILASQHDYIEGLRLQSYVKKHKSEIVQEINNYSQAGDYKNIKNLGEKYDICAYNSEIKEYYPIYKFATDYEVFLSSIKYFKQVNNSNNLLYSELPKNTNNEYTECASSIFDLYTSIDLENYSLDEFDCSDETVRANLSEMLNLAKQRSESLIKDTFYLNDDDIAKLENYSYARISLILQERYDSHEK